MKFEKPIVEIEKFDLKDVISASAVTETTSESLQTVSEGHCHYNSARDTNPNWITCG